MRWALLTEDNIVSDVIRADAEFIGAGHHLRVRGIVAAVAVHAPGEPAARDSVETTDAEPGAVWDPAQRRFVRNNVRPPSSDADFEARVLEIIAKNSGESGGAPAKV